MDNAQIQSKVVWINIAPRSKGGGVTACQWAQVGGLDVIYTPGFFNFPSSRHTHFARQPSQASTTTTLPPATEGVFSDGFRLSHLMSANHKNYESSPYTTTGGKLNDTDSAYATFHEQHSTTTLVHPSNEPSRDLLRTPPPTEEELRELKSGAIDWKTISNWRFWIRREWICPFIALRSWRGG